MDVIGHRGAAGEAPENTLAAIERGLAAGSAGIEIDVRLADGLVVVLHDAALDRTTGAGGLVYERSAADLRALAPALVTLEPVAVACRERRLNVEFKDVAVVAPALALRPAGAEWLVSSFLVAALARARELAPDLPRALCADAPDALDQALELGCESLHLPVQCIDAATCARIHAAGLRVLAFTCNERDERDRLAAAGCDGIFTDLPSLLIER